MEFFVMIGVVFAIFLVLLFFVQAQNQSINELKLRTNQEQVCNVFATAVNSVYIGGSGFTAHITLPQDMSGISYTLVTDNRTGVVTANSEPVFCRLMTSQLNYTEPIPKGELDIVNRDGTIFIE